MRVNFYTLLLIGLIISLFLMAFMLESPDFQVEQGLWGFIDDSVLVFLMISLPFASVLLAYRLAGKRVRRLFKKKSLKDADSSSQALNLMLNPLFLLLWSYDKLKAQALRIFSVPPLKYAFLLVFAVVLITILSVNNFINWKPFSTLGSVLRNSIMIIGMIAAYNFALEKGLFSSKNFWKSELTKFGAIIFGALISLILANTVAFEIDKLTFMDVQTSVEQNKNVLIMGFVLSFAIANLINNLTLKRLYG